VDVAGFLIQRVGFSGGGEALGAAPGLGQVVGEVVDRGGEVGQVGVAVAGGQLPVEVDDFLGGRRGHRMITDLSFSGR